MQVEFTHGNVVVDAALLGPMLGLAPADVPELMRRNEITSLCERGIDEDDGHYRLSFFHGRRCVRLKVDGSGNILQRSTVDYGTPPPAKMPAQTGP